MTLIILTYVSYVLFIVCLGCATLNKEVQSLPIKTKWWIVGTAFFMCTFEYLYLYVGFNDGVFAK